MNAKLLAAPSLLAAIALLTGCASAPAAPAGVAPAPAGKTAAAPASPEAPGPARPAPAPAPAPAVQSGALGETGLPAGWQAGPGLASLGAKLLSYDYLEAGGVARMRVALPEGLSLAYGLRDLDRKLDAASMPGAVSISKKNGESSVAIVFPLSGSYSFSLYAGAGTGQYQQVLSAPFAVKVPACPENWKASLLARLHAIDLSAAPTRSVGERLAFDLRIPEGMKVLGSISSKDRALRAPVKIEAAGGRLSVKAAFPAGGSYDLTLSAAEPGTSLFQEFAKASFSPELPAGSVRYFLPDAKGDWPVLPVAAATPVKGEWKPFGSYPKYGDRLSASLSADFPVPGLPGLAIPKDAAVEFALNWTGLVEALGFAMPADYVAKLAEGELRLKTGERSAVGFLGYDMGRPSTYLAGTTAQDARLAFAPNVLAVPAGSKVVSANASVSSVELGGPGTFSSRGASYPCVQGVLAGDYWDGAKSLSSVRVTLARDSELAVGSARYALPALSLVTFSGDSVLRLVFSKDSAYTAGGVRDAAKAGWAFDLGPDGTPVRKYQVED